MQKLSSKNNRLSNRGERLLVANFGRQNVAFLSRGFLEARYTYFYVSALYVNFPSSSLRRRGLPCVFAQENIMLIKGLTGIGRRGVRIWIITVIMMAGRNWGLGSPPIANQRQIILLPIQIVMYRFADWSQPFTTAKHRCQLSFLRDVPLRPISSVLAFFGVRVSDEFSWGDRIQTARM